MSNTSHFAIQEVNGPPAIHVKALKTERHLDEGALGTD